MIPQAIEQRLARIGEEFDLVAIDGGGDVDTAHFAALS